MMFRRLGWLGLLLFVGCLRRPLTEVSPETNNLFVDQLRQSAIDKIDLLFMIDNSTSMSDKQEILKQAVPVLLSRLVSPICVDEMGKPTGASTQANGQCPANQGRPEFNPVGDIHIGVISSSLGAHGGLASDGAQCAEPSAAIINPDDKAHLIGSTRPEQLPLSETWNNSGFLAWDSAGKAGTNDPQGLFTVFQDMIGAVGERGCGYEASLESWYRFLVDPEPPANVTRAGNITVRSSKLTVNADGSTGACVGCDETLLAQRKAFLRPDSLVAIVMLSDENDCSIRDDSSGWFVGSQSRMPRSSSQCEVNPNDPCCRSCAASESNGPPPGCPALSSDANCKDVVAPAKFATLPGLNDSPNLRCYDQRRRFGFDLLYETARYVNALTQPRLQLQSAAGTFVRNPLFDGGANHAPRDPSLVFLAGIVGVPWQDIADEASLAGPGLTYLTAKELTKKGRWRDLLGDPSANPPRPPSDPFMVETPAVRSGTNAIAGVSISAATSSNPHDNPINGHEHNIPNLDDLQYACTFPLKTPKTCTDADGQSCDCAPRNGNSQAVVDANSPLCQGGPTINTQTAAKAYPGTRELSVLQGLGDNAIVASICPKVIDAADPSHPSADPNYGYNPAVNAILARLKITLAGKCLPRALKSDDQGQALCRVVEAQEPPAECNCQAEGRAELASADISRDVRTQLQLAQQCGGANQTPCKDWCMCEIKQVDPAHLAACQTNQGGVPPGYCYINDQAKAGATPEVARAIDEQLARCDVNERQQLRFVDTDPAHKTPAKGAYAFIACLGASLEP
jgi:hypothetical protein